MKNYCIFSFDGGIFPIARQLVEEDNKVWVCQVEDGNDLGVESWINDESPERKERRLSLYDGLLKKNSLSKTMAMLENIPNKEDYFIIFDYNTFCNIAEQVLDMGFTNGHFPITEDFEREKDRKAAKDFVQKNYQHLKLIEYREMVGVDNVIKFIEESDKIWVIKSDGNMGETIVPDSDNIEEAKHQVIGELQADQKAYDSGKLILEEKIPKPIEFTPQMMWYDGVPISSAVEIETRMFGSCDIGPQTGGNQNILVQTPLDCRLNKMFFPQAVHDIAAQRKGMFIFDAGILYDGYDFYFTEFAGNRHGWGGIFSEVSMSLRNGKMSSSYYESIMKGKNPYTYRYGSSLALYSLHQDTEVLGTPQNELPFKVSDRTHRDMFTMQMKKEEGKSVSVGYRCLDSGPFAYIAGRGNDVYESINSLYESLQGVSFKGLYYRPKHDFLTKEYTSSVLNRLDKIKYFLQKEFNLGE